MLPWERLTASSGRPISAPEAQNMIAITDAPPRDLILAPLSKFRFSRLVELKQARVERRIVQMDPVDG